MKTCLPMVLLLALTACADPPTPPTPAPESSAMPARPDKIMRSDDEWKKQLTPEQYRVTRTAGTERPYTNRYDKHFEKGSYHCVCCDAELFQSTTKFDSGCGWPAFWQSLNPAAIIEREDRTHGMVRVEVLCARCDAHLGHVFKDGPPPTGIRYCINSEAMVFKPTGAGVPETAPDKGGK